MCLPSNTRSLGGSSVLDEVKRVYNDFGQMTREYQEHDGEVDGSSLHVDYAYANPSSGTTPNTTRKTTYPNSTTISTDYGAGTPSALSRPSAPHTSRQDFNHKGEAIGERPNPSVEVHSPFTEDPKATTPQIQVTCEKAFGKGWREVGQYHSHPPGGGTKHSGGNNATLAMRNRFTPGHRSYLCALKVDGGSETSVTTIGPDGNPKTQVKENP